MLDSHYIYRKNWDLLVFGNNKYGQLGLGDNKYINIPTLLMNDRDIKIICNGLRHSIIYKDSGDLLVFGDNTFGQLGFRNPKKYSKYIHNPILLMNDKNIKMIYCGGYHSVIYKNNGDLLVFGNNKYGQLGLRDNKNRCIPKLLMNEKNIKMIHCGEFYSMIYKNNGDLLVFGSNESGQLGLGDCENRYIPTLLMSDREIKMISGRSHSYNI